jgi:uncharacterized protein (DUF1697 family)
MTTGTRYVALLRGINMTGRKVVPMSELAELFSSLELKDVRTLLATGNVIFEKRDSGERELISRIEAKLRRSLGYEVKVLLRTIAELDELVRLDPFKKEKIDNRKAKAFVTFLAASPSTSMKLPFTHAKGEFKIVGVGPREVFSVRYALAGGRFGDSVTFIEREFGLPTTSRNYSTVVKLAATRKAS